MYPMDGAQGAHFAELLAGQNQALELAVKGGPLQDVLKLLVEAAETQSDGYFRGSILLLSDDGKRLLHGAAPSLPAAYNDAIHGIEIGPRVGSCGTAAHFGHSIFVTDISRDPLWADFKDLALAHGLQACWSTPIFAQDQSVLGTLALYYHQPRGPSEHDRNVVKLIGATAGLVIENARLHARLHDEIHRARLAADVGKVGFFTWDVGGDTVSWQNEYPYAIFGVERGEAPINAQRFVEEFLDPADRPAFAAAVSQALEGGTSFHFVGGIRRKSDGAARRVEFKGEVDPGALARGVRRVVGVAADVTGAAAG